MLNTFVRDPITNIVINNNEKEYKEYQSKIELIRQINELKEEIKMLKLDLNAVIKDLTKMKESN